MSTSHLVIGLGLGSGSGLGLVATTHYALSLCAPSPLLSPAAPAAFPEPPTISQFSPHLHHQAKESSQSFRTLVLIGVAAACAVLTPFSTCGLCAAGRKLCCLLSRRHRQRRHG